MPLRIENALIATLNESHDVFMGDISIEEPYIAKIRPTASPGGAAGPIQAVREGDTTVIRGNGCLALPGLINGHIHSYRNCLRFVPQGLDDLPREADNRPDLTLAEAEAILRLSYLEAVQAGVTYACDFPQWLRAFPAVLPFKVARQVGLKGCLRVVLSHDSYEPGRRAYFTSPDEPDPDLEYRYLNSGGDGEDADTGTIRDIAGWIVSNGGAENYQIGIWIPWETQGRRGSDKFNDRTLGYLSRVIDECRDPEISRGVPLIPLMHFAERSASASPQAFYNLLNRYPTLANGMVLFHSIHLQQAMIARIRSGPIGGCVTCPKFTDNRLSPLGRLIDAGIAVGVGTDYGGWDIFPAIGLVPKFHRLFEGMTSERRVEYREALDMAALEGARVYRLADAIGSLEEGKRADIVLIDRQTLPLSLPALLTPGKEQGAIEQFIRWEALNSRSVHTVIIDGEPVIRNRRLTRKGVSEANTKRKGIEAALAIQGRIDRAGISI